MKKIFKKALKKKYRHFDYNPSERSAEKFINEVVYNKNKVAHYRFFPFILFHSKKSIYHRTKGKLRAHFRVKMRPLSLVAHHDSYIYTYYASLLSNSYENYLINNSHKDLVNVPTAYREKIHSSNITAAREVFDFIVDSKECLIIKGDFKGFFDNLRHKVLIENLCRVLGVDEISEDWRAVIKSLTKYHFIYSKDINIALKRARLQNEHDGPYVKNRKEISKLIKYGGLKVHGPSQIGIPQGTSLSAVLANVYMIEFDASLNELIQNMNGIYRRYSDDFIIVIPSKYIKISRNEIFNKIQKISDRYSKLTIERHKTKHFIYNYNKIKSIDENNNHKLTWLEYLGFIFNGNVVKIRDKSVYKYHRKSKHGINLMIRTINDIKHINDNYYTNPKNHKRRVWKNKKQIFANLNQITKQNEFNKRINNVKKHRSITNTKTVAKMYLSHKRYGEKFSMVGYAKRAQRIFQSNNKYKVDVLKQINRQVTNNQKYINRIRNKK